MLYVVVDGFFGDSGKGKIVSYLSIADDVDIVARGGVGPNAGHTVVFSGKTYKLRQVPSGFVNKNSCLLIGPGVLINPDIFFNEIRLTGTEGRIFMDYKTGVIEGKHIAEDRRNSYLSKKIGTTGSGTGPAMCDRAMRTLKLAKDYKYLKDYLIDVSLEINNALDKNKKVILEGSQGTFLSLYHGTYPYVTSKDVIASAICSDIGIGPKRVDEIVLVFKSYVTRVGMGPLENEYSVEDNKKLGLLEIATVTGRVRRAAPFNFNYAKRAVMLNSPTQVAITKIDVLYKDNYGVREWSKLSSDAKKFISEIEEKLNIPVTLISTGPDTKYIIDRRKELGFV